MSSRTPEPAFTAGPMRWQAPVGRHRHSASVRLGRWLAALGTAVVVVALGGAVTNSELSYDQRFREFVTTGAMGEWVSNRTFDLNVLAVRTAATISAGSGAGQDTAGVWVLVRVQVMADREPVWIDYATVRDSTGRIWSATQRIEQPLIDYRLDPRIPVEAELAFEVPQAAATDLTLRLAEGTGSLYGLQMATVAEVRLPVDAAAVAGALADSEPEPAVIEPPKIVIADPQILVGVGEGGR